MGRGVRLVVFNGTYSRQDPSSKLSLLQRPKYSYSPPLRNSTIRPPHPHHCQTGNHHQLYLKSARQYTVLIRRVSPRCTVSRRNTPPHRLQTPPRSGLHQRVAPKAQKTGFATASCFKPKFIDPSLVSAPFSRVSIHHGARCLKLF